MKIDNLKVIMIKILLYLVFIFFIVGVVLLIYSLFFIEQKSTVINKKVDSPKEECIIEAETLNVKCSASSISLLDLKTLEKCDWLTSDKNEFLIYCNEEPSMMKMIGDIVDEESKNTSKTSTIFWNQIIEICQNTKIGNLTAQQLADCKGILNDYPEEIDSGTY